MHDDQANTLFTSGACVCNAEHDETPSIPAIARTIVYLNDEHDRALGKHKIRTIEQAAAVARVPLPLTGSSAMVNDPDPAAMLHWQLARFVLMSFEMGAAQ
jgi:hypothetical protein